MVDGSELCSAMCHILGNTCRIFRTTRSYEWNVSGRGAELARLCFHEQACELEAAVTPLAHHILGLGGRPIFDYSDGIVEVNPPTPDDILCLPEMMCSLHEGHTQAKLSLGAALDVARDIDELSTVQILADRIDKHRLHRYRLALLMQEF